MVYTHYELEWWSLDKIKPYKNNPRKNTKAIEVLKKSIKHFGFKVPILVDKQGVIIAGHTRYEASKQLKLKKIPVIVAKDFTPEQVKAFRIMDNKSQEYSEWDEAKLVEELKQLKEDYVSLTGFSEEELALLFDKYDFPLPKEEIEQKESEMIKVDNKYNIKKGDLIVINKKHKIICGDSKNPEIWKARMQGDKADFCFTSPPYNIGKQYNEYNDAKEWDKYVADMEKIFANVKENMQRGRFVGVNVIMQLAKTNLLAKWDRILTNKGFYFYEHICWEKPLGAGTPVCVKHPFPRFWRPMRNTEEILIYYLDDQPPRFADWVLFFKTTNEISRDKSNRLPKGLEYKYLGSVWHIQPETNVSQHIAPFPIKLPEVAINLMTKKEEIVLDPFCGSGTTIIACARNGRKGYGIEIDPAYCSLAIDRIKKMFEGAEIEVISDEGKTRRYI